MGQLEADALERRRAAGSSRWTCRSVAVEERIPPRAAEGDERVLDGGPDLALAPRLACADALARACVRARG